MITKAPNKMAPVHKVGLALFRDQQVIMARHHRQIDRFITLGGKLEAEETDLDCLKREVMEEASAQIKPGSLEFFAAFDDFIDGDPQRPLNIRLYRGELLSEPVPSSEIAEFRYFDSTADPKHLTPITRDHIFPWLKQHGLIT